MAIIVGDIHGNVEKVKAFLAHKPEEEHVCLGDIVDSEIEPPSRQIECLNLLFDARAVLLWGNHDIQYADFPYKYSCSGYIQDNPVLQIVRDNKQRFKAAHAVDGYILTHAGVCTKISNGCTDPVELAENLNQRLLILEKEEKTRVPVGNSSMNLYERLMLADEEAKLRRDPIFYVSAHRGGRDDYGGIFWFDPFCEEGIDRDLRQVYGHCEIDTPPVLDEYGHINLNYFGRDTCYLFDTKLSEVVKIDIQPMSKRKLQNLCKKQVSKRMSGSYYHPDWKDRKHSWQS